MASKKEYELAIRIAGEIDKSLKSSMGLTEKELKKIARQAAKTSAQMNSSFNNGFKQVGVGFESLSGIASKTFAAIKKAALVAVTATALIATASVYVGTQYEAQMSTVQAISGATGTEFEALKDKAKEMGEKTVFSATEAGQAMEYMAMAGWKTSDMLNGIEGIMNLAAASGEDLASVSDIVTDALTAFGLKASDSGHFADVLAAASSNSNTNVSMMGETFTYAASVAGALGYSIEDTALQIGLMANSGIKASQAGTALRKIMANTAQGIKLSSKAMGEYVISASNADGSMRSLNDLIGDMRFSFSKMTEQEKAANAESIAGKTAMGGLLAIVNASDADYGKLQQSIENCTGAAEEMANTRLDNLSGDLTLLKSAAEGFGIKLYEQMSGPLREGAKMATNAIGSLSKNFSKYLPTAIRHLKNTKNAFSEFAVPFLDVGKWLLKNPKIIVSTLAGIGTTLATYSIAKKIYDISAAMLSLGPAGAVAVGIAGTVAIIGTAAAYFSQMRDDIAKNNLSEHFGNITLSLDGLDAAARQIVGNNYFGKINDLMSAVGNSDGFLKSMEEASNQINGTHWKLSVGLTMSDEDMNDYQQNVETYVKNAQDYINNQGLTVQVATSLLLGDSADSMNTDNNAFFTEMSKKATGLSNQISEELQKAMENGLTIDEEQTISNLMQQLDDITSGLAQAQNEAKLQVIQAQFSGKELDAESFQNLQQKISEYTDQVVAGADEALTQSLSTLNYRLDSGDITKVEFDDKKATYMQGYYQTQADAILQGYDFMKNTIMDTYGSEIEPALYSINEAIKTKTDSLMTDNSTFRTLMAPEDYSNALQNIMNEAVSTADLSSDAKNAVNMLLEGMAPTEEQLSTLSNQIAEAGGEVPKEISDAITSADNIAAVAGSTDDMWKMIGSTLGESDTYAALIEAAKQQGGAIDQNVIDGINEKQPEAELAAKNMLNAMKKQLGEGFDASVPISITYSTASDYLKGGKEVAHNADGGIIMSPTLSTFAENCPEAAIPLDGSQRSISLWETVGNALGVTGKESKFTGILNSMNKGESGGTVENNTEGSNVQYSPIMNFYGNSPQKEDLDESNSKAQEEFEKMIKRYLKDNKRVAFS